MAADTPTLGDVIRRFSPALLARQGGLSPARHAVLSTLARCHTAALGGHLYRCDSCGAEHPAYNACGNRHCPSCLGHRSAEWLAERAAELLPVPYFHVVFTVPAEIAALALGNKKVVYSILFRAVAETLLEACANPDNLGADIGFLAILHTWTQTLLHHPHVHCVIPGGGISADRSRWVPSRESFFVHDEILSRLYRGKFLSYLWRAASAGLLRFGGETAALATPAAFASFIREQKDKAWVVYIKPPFGSPERVLKYLARYTHRVAISDRRILSMSEREVTFRYRDNERGPQEMSLDGVEFLRRFLLHVLPTGFVRIRYYGLMANRVRAKNVSLRRQLIACSAVVATPAPAPAVTAEVDPMAEDERHRCPSCKAGVLRYVGMLGRTPLPEVDGWALPLWDTS